MAEVILKDVMKIYPNAPGEGKKKKKKGEEPEKKHNLQITERGVVAVQQFNLSIADKEFIVLVGPSGCGKSTTLRMIAGLEEISEGEVIIDGRVVNDVPPKDRDIAMVFQNYALYPHMTVYDNMAFSLKLKKVDKATIDQKVREAAEILDITQYLDRKPKALSGGQRINTTFVYVTHDQTEAMTLGDRIVIMRDGFIQQIGTPQEVFNHPANIFVAGFIGTPQMNFFDDAELVLQDGKYCVNLYGTHFELDEAKQAKLRENKAKPGVITLGIRPEHMTLCGDDAVQHVTGTVDVSEMMGSSIHLHSNVHGKDVVTVVSTVDLPEKHRQGFTYGETIKLAFGESVMHVFDKDTGVALT